MLRSLVGSEMCIRDSTISVSSRSSGARAATTVSASLRDRRPVNVANSRSVAVDAVLARVQDLGVPVFSTTTSAPQPTTLREVFGLLRYCLVELAPIISASTPNLTSTTAPHDMSKEGALIQKDLLHVYAAVDFVNATSAFPWAIGDTALPALTSQSLEEGPHQGAGYEQQRHRHYGTGSKMRPSPVPLAITDGRSTLFHIHASDVNRVDMQQPVSYTHLTLPTKRIV
eukprot:TRINITY_DN6018_c0_g1_i8.p1 TRINITY_DN6018_c0_g1~~TRINITY_DN6018_c0_g1_i8.p1  ORF type:complete len:228 (-),score=30.16 TRINITY_DN6018_c0_g1_i8:80-763(-)